MKLVVTTSVRSKVKDGRVYFLGCPQTLRYTNPAVGPLELVLARVFDRRNKDRTWVYISGKFL